jgi:hypothetical protein
VEARDSRSVTDPPAVLDQWYEIEEIPIHVKYNMVDP